LIVDDAAETARVGQHRWTARQRIGSLAMFEKDNVGSLLDVIVFD
jgi:hypothetical protein